MKKVIVFVILLMPFYVMAQKIDAVDIAKMYMFLNQSYTTYFMPNMINKNDFSYLDFKNSFEIKLDTLEITDELEEITDYNKDNNFFEFIDGKLKYTFYKINIDSITNEPFFIGSFAMMRYCVIAIQESTGKSYRIIGFDNNDLLSFLSDFRSQYLKVNHKNISINQILKYFKVECVDFECLYNGLTDKNWIRTAINCKYPCLWRINDGFNTGYNHSKKCQKMLKKNKSEIINKCNCRNVD
ncbi:MAG: hypothetical protein LBC68_06610 [Prevotellaceae bacterium]|jgi:hypothetical protein|nr:hypothetical protein [Prevotellaceae bacterium]